MAVVVQAPQLSRSACGGRHMKGLAARPLATLWDGRDSVGRYPVIEGRMAGLGGIASSQNAVISESTMLVGTSLPRTM
jgi:hypothetical protein